MVGDSTCKITWILVWSWVLVSVGRTRLGGRIPAVYTLYQLLPAAVLNTHTMISSILFYILIVGLLAYASYLKHQIKRK